MSGGPFVRRGAGSITARLAVLFTASSTVLLGLVVVVFYRGVSDHLDAEHRDLLAEVVRLLRVTRSSGAAAWIRPSAVAPSPDGGDETVRGEKYAFRILDAAGGVVFESRGMAGVPRSAFAAVPVAGPDAETAGVQWRGAGGSHFLLAAATLAPGGELAEGATVQVALNVAPDDELLAEVRTKGGLILALGVIASGVAGALAARHGLRPIDRMAAEMQQTSARHLSRQIEHGGFPSELHGLVRAFNDMLDRLERAFADVSAYSANLAHELRTPLGNLRGEAEVALLRARTVEEYRDVLASSLEELDRLARMVDALLFLARADRRETSITRASIALGREALGVAEFFAPVAEEQGVALRVVGDAQAEVDPELFRRALANLLSNALRHTATAGTVTVTVAEPVTGWVEVAVEDNGCGIPAEELPRVFERFFRGSGWAGGEVGGSGLGLAIVRSIAELHGGSVGVASTPGSGTRVAIRVPRSR